MQTAGIGTHVALDVGMLWTAGVRLDLRRMGIACGAFAVAAGLLIQEVSAQMGADKPSAQARVKKYIARMTHRLVIQVDQNDKAVMDLALNNAQNVIDYYKSRGEIVYMEIVAFGPGLHMLRSDTSPVRDRIGPMVLEHPNLTFIACGNTLANQIKAEGKRIKLLSETKVVPSGVVRLMELQNQGYAYIRP
jgi:intracellular sulfur oxidation DsrE/DsrF family protein